MKTDIADTTSLTAADRIAAILRDRIVNAEIADGAALRQDHIAREFGTSHVPVREALQRLEAWGLAASSPRRGMRVTELSSAMFRETAEMRAALEVLALRHAARKFEPADLDALEAAQVRCEAASSLGEWDVANRAFHGLLVGACGMPRLLATLDNLQLANSRFLISAGRARGWQPRSNHDHRLILDALKAKDVERALQALARHIGTMERVGFPSAPPT